MSSGAPGNIRDLQHRLEIVERENKHQRQLLDKLLELRASSQETFEQVKLAKTYASSPGSWPSFPADTFDIRFVDDPGINDAWTPSFRNPTWSPRSDSGQTVATAFDGRFLLPDKIVEVALINNKHYIVGGPGIEYSGRLLGALSKGGSASMEIIEWNGTQQLRTGYTMTVHDRWLNAGETIEAKVKIDVRLKSPGRYEVVNAWCDVDDNLDSFYDAPQPTSLVIAPALMPQQQGQGRPPAADFVQPLV